MSALINVVLLGVGIVFLGVGYRLGWTHHYDLSLIEPDGMKRYRRLHRIYFAAMTLALVCFLMMGGNVLARTAVLVPPEMSYGLLGAGALLAGVAAWFVAEVLRT